MKNIKKYLIAAGGLVAVMLFVFFGPPNVYHETSTPGFCNTCHVPEHEAWFLTGLHRNASCVDCHLPNSGAIRHLIWKGATGTRDMVMFYTGLYDEPIKTTSFGKKILQENCLRCHSDMVAVMNTDDRDCWSCHRRVNHNFPMVGLR